MSGLSRRGEGVDESRKIVGRLGTQGPFQALVTKPHPRVTPVCTHPDGDSLAVDSFAKFAEGHGAGNDQHFAQKITERAHPGSVTPERTVGPPLNVAEYADCSAIAPPASHRIFNL
jgi:hypothetical protein